VSDLDRADMQQVLDKAVDATEVARRFLIPQMPAELADRIARGEPVWNTEQMQEQFQVIGFEAPFVVVQRRSDGVKGSLLFTHNPRYYFGWEAAE